MPAALIALDLYVGKSIADICENNFSATTQNHCAHFVSHALGLRLGLLCGNMTFKRKAPGGSIRCDEIYNRLVQRGPWAEKPTVVDGLLIFVTSATNVQGGTMLNVPQKHVGIHYGGRVFNFSNRLHKVVVDQNVEAFHAKFRQSYAGDDVSLFFGVAP